MEANSTVVVLVLPLFSLFGAILLCCCWFVKSPEALAVGLKETNNNDNNNNNNNNKIDLKRKKMFTRSDCPKSLLTSSLIN